MIRKPNKFILKSYSQRIMLRFRNEEDKQIMENKLGVKLHKGIRTLMLPSKYKSARKDLVETVVDAKVKCKDSIKEWKQMPEFLQEKIDAHLTIEIIVTKESYIKDLAKIMEQTVTNKTKSLYYPKLERRIDTKYITPKAVNPTYTIHIISKSRPLCITAQKLKESKVPYKIVIEPLELDMYLEHHPREDLLLLPFNNLGQGSIPARNWVWEYSISQGEKWHWILDDNIYNFYRFNKNKKSYMHTGAGFKALEDFVERYTNVAQAGFQYGNFCQKDLLHPAYVLNTRVYSCILIRNDLDFRWRGRYNEDTDLSLRMMKAGWCTILCNAFLVDKATTMTCKGGNTKEVYVDDDKRMKFAESLRDQHPDLVKIKWQWDRWHHHVDYSVFKTMKLKIKEEYKDMADIVDNYTMELQEVE